jgi:hypothetical protein
MVPFLSAEVVCGSVLLLVAVVLFPVKPAFTSTLGVSTTNEERDLCFLFAGSIVVGPFGETTFPPLIGNSLFLTS